MKIRLLHSGSGDWIGLYVDGKLLMENHSLDESEVITALMPEVDFKDVWSTDEYLEEYGNS